MSSFSDYVKCKQCGFERACYDLDSRTSEESVTCGMCGYYAACEKAVDSEGKIIWSYPAQEGFGAMCYGHDHGFATHLLHSLKSVEDSEKWLRKKLESGEVEASRSYLTCWNPQRKAVEFVIGSSGILARCWR
jgi:hypothetical protein